MDNLNERELRKTGAKNNLVANMHLAYMTVGYDCPFVGERLRNSGLRKRFGVSVSSIQRGSNIIMVPDADARLFPGDILGVIGTDDEIQKLIPVIEASDEGVSATSPEDIRLTSVRLTDSSPLIGRTVASSRLREDYEALLVATQRDENYTQPSPEMSFAEGDVLWIVGDVNKLASLA